MKAIFDTNILVDYLRGFEEAKAELTRYEGAGISLITWMEILVGADDESEEQQLREFLLRFDRIDVNQAIAERAVKIRMRERVRLPDAVILATAEQTSSLLVTRNVKDFSVDNPQVRVPYEL